MLRFARAFPARPPGHLRPAVRPRPVPRRSVRREPHPPGRVHRAHRRPGGGEHRGRGGTTSRSSPVCPGCPPYADRVVFAVSSFDGSTFETVQSAHCRIVDESLGHELARYVLPAHGPHTALIMAEVTRAGGAWTMTALGEPVACTTFADLLQAAEV
ncbi:TerD family protein [Streptomyces gardneri]|uniref:TerD family protein n=1 Tax=Streptomyces gardneri TaxID=66892 RepID=UPI0033F558DF